jgi:hypothetical protein
MEALFMRMNYRKLLLGVGVFFAIPLWGMERDEPDENGVLPNMKDRAKNAVQGVQAARQAVFGQRQFRLTRETADAVVDGVKHYGPSVIGAVRQELPNALPRVQEHVDAITSSESLSRDDKRNVQTIVDKLRRQGPELMNTLEQRLTQRINTLAIDEDTRTRLSNLVSINDANALERALQNEATLLLPVLQQEITALAAKFSADDQQELFSLFLKLTPSLPQLSRAVEERLPQVVNDLKTHGPDALRRIGTRVLGPQLTPEQQAEFQRIEREGDELLRNTDVDGMIREAEQQIVRDENALEEQKREKVRWQNTLLWATTGTGIRFGLYNQDMLKGSLWAINMMSDMFLYKRLQVIRVAKINNEIKAHYEELLEHLNKLKEAQRTFDKEYDEKSLIGQLLVARKRQRNALADPVRNYIRNQHALIYSNPFRQETIFPLTLRFIVEKLGSLLEEKYIERVPITDPLHWNYYEYNEQGRRVEQNDLAPFSLVTIARKGVQVLTNPISALTSLIFESGYEGADFIYSRLLKSQGQQAESKIAKLGYKALRAVYSQPGKIVLKFLELGAAAKIFDTVSSDLWIDYVLKKQDKLIDILTQYKEAKDSFKDTAVLKEIEARIQKFVQHGHNPVTFVPARLLRQWFSARNSANSQASFFLTLPIAGIAGWKLYRWYKETIGKTETATTA